MRTPIRVDLLSVSVHSQPLPTGAGAGEEVKGMLPGEGRLSRETKSKQKKGGRARLCGAARYNRAGGGGG